MSAVGASRARAGCRVDVRGRWKCVGRGSRSNFRYDGAANRVGAAAARGRHAIQQPRDRSIAATRSEAQDSDENEPTHGREIATRNSGAKPNWVRNEPDA